MVKLYNDNMKNITDNESKNMVGLSIYQKPPPTNGFLFAILGKPRMLATYMSS